MAGSAAGLCTLAVLGTRSDAREPGIFRRL